MEAGSANQEDPKAEPRAFDLNSEEVLEHWPVAYAVRELIANALDEHHLTGTAEPVVAKQDDGSWVIQDFGRGLRYKHLTQKENPGKLEHPEVIGQFGMGLKDALAVCERHKIGVAVRSPHGDITTERRPKVGFQDVETLHGLISPPSDADRSGTRIEVTGISDADVDQAKSAFLHYSGDTLLEQTKHGDVLAKRDDGACGKIYVKGLLVAEEPNFLFSYNITNVTERLRAALNRERSNVGRGAYSDRVKAILKACRTAEVAGPLAEDLGRFASGRMHEELSVWNDVAVHACGVLNSQESVVFITPSQANVAAVEYAKQDGHRPIIVSDKIAKKLPDEKDLEGKPLRDFARYQAEFNDSFRFAFVAPKDLSESERAVFALRDAAVSLAGLTLSTYGVLAVKVSETMRLEEQGAQVVGQWEPTQGRIVIRRDQLASAAQFCGTLLHEMEHAASGHGDGTLAFEDALTSRLGVVAASGLAVPPNSPKGHKRHFWSRS